jgi:hypothetical protein
MSSAHALRALPRVAPDRPRVAADRPRASSSRSRVAFRAKATTRDAPFEDDDDLTYADLAEEEARLISANAKKYDGPGAVLGVSRAFAVQVSEKAVKEALPGRGVLEYVRLPAEEYNVLDSDAVTRVGEHTFRVAAGAQKILWLEVEPVGVISIRPTEDGCEQILLGATMADAKARRTGGKENGIVAAMNASLRDLRMCNRIRATYGEDAVRTPSSRPDTISCQIDIGGTFTEGPFAAAGSDRLNGVLQWCLGGVMPWFLNQLSNDYGDWSLKQPRGRREVNVAAVASEILNGTSKGILPPGVREEKTMPSKFEDGTEMDVGVANDALLQ